nr:hypothetical protein [Helicobacter sp.]
DTNTKEIQKIKFFTPIIAIMPAESFYVAHLNETQNDSESFAHALLQLNLDGSEEYFFARPNPKVGYIYPQSLLCHEIMELQRHSFASLVAVPCIAILPAFVPSDVPTLVVWAGEDNFVAIVFEGLVRFFQALKPDDSIAAILANLIPVLNFHQLFPQRVLSTIQNDAIADFCTTSGIEMTLIEACFCSEKSMEFVQQNPQICWVEDSKIECTFFSRLILLALFVCFAVLAIPLWEYWGAYWHYQTQEPQESSEKSGVDVDRFYIRSLLVDSDFPLESLDDSWWHKLYEINHFDMQYLSQILLNFTSHDILQGVNIQKVKMDYASRILQFELSAVDYGMLVAALERLKQIHAKPISVNQTQKLNGYYLVHIGIVL